MTQVRRADGGARRPPTVRLATPGGIRGSLHLTEGGVGTVVCVHGALDGAASFARVRRRLSCAVVAYDRRGYRSSRSATITEGLAVHVDDLLEVVDVARRDGALAPVVVLGHSFGGLVALGAAASSDAIASLVVYEPPFPWLRDRADDPHPIASSDPSSAAEAFFRRIVGDGAWDRLGEREREARRLDGDALVADLAVLAGPRPVDPGLVTVPVAVGLSAGAPPRRRESAVALVAALPAARLVDFDRAGHGAHLSSPGQLAALADEVVLAASRDPVG